MEYPDGSECSGLPINTFRPIQDGGESNACSQYGILSQSKVSVCSPTYTSPLSPSARPGPKLAKAWRQGSETWSSTGSRQSSRPGSAAQAGSRPPSAHLYCKSGNSSNSDVSVARNFQQLSVSNRRAAFKTQKWSHSFDHSCLTSSPSIPKRRQTSLQQKSLDLDSGYLGSPASGLVSSQSHSWMENIQQQNTQLIHENSLAIDNARKELAVLINSQEADPINRSLSLPSFSQSFQGSGFHEHIQDFCVLNPCNDPVPAQDELDALDEEIKQIVGDLRSPGHTGVTSPLINTEPAKECLKPTPIRSSTITFSPTGYVTGIEESSLLTHSGGRVIIVSPQSPRSSSTLSEAGREMPTLPRSPSITVGAPMKDSLLPPKISKLVQADPSTASRDGNHKRLVELERKAAGIEGPAMGLIREEEDCDKAEPVMLAVVSTVYQKYQVPRHFVSAPIKIETESVASNKQTVEMDRDASRQADLDNPVIGEVISVNRSNSKETTGSQSPQFVFKKTCEFSGKVVDLPKPKPFRASYTAESCPVTGGREEKFDKMLLEAPDSQHHFHHQLYNDLPLHSPCSPSHNFSLSSPSSPQQSSYHSPSYNASHNFNFFQFPVHQPSEPPTLIKEEPLATASLDVSASQCQISARNSASPMVLSPVVSNLNTPRVSLSSVHSDFSAKLRSSHSSLQCSPHNSPLAFMEHGVGGFGHSLNALSDLTGHHMETSPEQSGYMTPPRSGYSSPLQEASYHGSAPPSYEQSLQNYQVTSSSPYLPPPYPYNQLTGNDPHLCPANPFTPEPESLQSEKEEQPDTPDSSIKEEPSEECSEEGITVCRWKSCGRDCVDLKSLVEHVTTNHLEHRKGCEEYPCFWDGCSRRYKPFNAKYKLLTHLRVHTGEKPHHCKQEGCNRKFARLENLKIHNRSHTGEKPFQCKYQCTKKFSNSSDRAKHEQTHIDPKPYRCEVPGCPKRYTDPSSLRKHVKNHSKEEQEQYKLCRERSLGQDQQHQLHWFDQEISSNLMGNQFGDFYPAIYRQQDEFHQYRRGIERQPDSLDSAEGEPALPYDSTPIRFDATDGFCMVAEYPDDPSRQHENYIL